MLQKAQNFKKRRRASSPASRVTVNYFDPEGVHELERILTIQSHAVRRSIEHHKGIPGSDDSTIVFATGGLETAQFDLENYLKDLVQQYVRRNSYFLQL